MALALFHGVMFLRRLVRPLMVQRDLRRAAFLCCDYSVFDRYLERAYISRLSYDISMHLHDPDM